MFMRLQRAWDANEQGDLFELTTPEMFAQLKRDLEGRGSRPSHAEVPQLDAEVLGVKVRQTKRSSACASTARCVRTMHRPRSRSRRSGISSEARIPEIRGDSRGHSATGSLSERRNYA